MADLIAHYRQHPLNEATGSILVKPVGAAVPAVNGTDDCYVIMEKPGEGRREGGREGGRGGEM